MLFASVLINSRSATAYQLSDICLPSQRTPNLLEPLVTILVPKKGATKAEKIAKGLKIYKNTKEVGKAPNFAYTVHVMGSFDKIEKWIDLI